MQQEFWPNWADFLTRWNLKPLVCDLANGNGTITPLIAQFLSLGAPVFGGGSRREFSAVLDLLEDEVEFAQFAAYLRESGK
jgi:hypothetical protein